METIKYIRIRNDNNTSEYECDTNDDDVYVWWWLFGSVDLKNYDLVYSVVDPIGKCEHTNLWRRFKNATLTCMDKQNVWKSVKNVRNIFKWNFVKKLFVLIRRKFHPEFVDTKRNKNLWTKFIWKLLLSYAHFHVKKKTKSRHSYRDLLYVCRRCRRSL